MRLLIITLIAIGELITAGASAQGNKTVGDRLETKIVIRDGDRILGQPTIRAARNKPVVVTKPGAGGYALRVTSEVSGDRAWFEGELWLVSSDNRWVKAAGPSLQMKPGTTATMTIAGDRRVDEGRGRTLRFEVSVGPSATDLAAATVKGSGCSGWTTAEWRAFLAKPTLQNAQYQLPTPCCSTGCLSCCGEGACCSDPHNCPSGGCCT